MGFETFTILAYLIIISIIVLSVKLHCLFIFMKMIVSIFIRDRSIFWWDIWFTCSTVESFTTRAFMLQMSMSTIFTTSFSIFFFDRCKRNNSRVPHSSLISMPIFDGFFLNSKSTDFSGTCGIFSVSTNIVGANIHSIWRCLGSFWFFEFFNQIFFFSNLKMIFMPTFWTSVILNLSNIFFIFIEFECFLLDFYFFRRKFNFSKTLQFRFIRIFR